jgi:hypothetical protein
MFSACARNDLIGAIVRAVRANENVQAAAIRKFVGLIAPASTADGDVCERHVGISGLGTKSIP